MQRGFHFFGKEDIGLPAWRGRSPLGVPFARSKGTKTRLGRSPLRTSLGYEAGPASSLYSARHPCCGPCLCHHTRPPWAAGPITWWFPPPGLPWCSGVPAAESFCRTILLRCGRGRGLPGPWLPWHCPGKFGRGKPLPYAHQSKKCGNFQGLFVSSPSRTALTRHPVPRGGFHKAGEGPAFGGLW